jgi:murein DD-endopeptidase MepM/ murein hydrolase activator NlpD
MKGARRLAAAIGMLLALRPGIARLGADSVALTSPAAATCTTDDGAVFTVENGALRPIRGQFMIYPTGGQELHPRTAVSLDGEPGQLLKMFLWSAEPLDSMSVQIGANGKSLLTKAIGFRVESRQGIELWVALVGIPPWSPPREHTLTLSAAAGERSYLLLQPFTVSSRPFFYERIPLTADQTDMATVPDEQKKTESRILAAVLATPHADAVFEKGAFIVPIPAARRTSGYGDRREYDYSDGTKGYSVHLGVDIASPIGTPVPACGQGRVVFAALRILTGNTVVVEHLPGLFSVYYHMSSIAVKVGDVVEKGQVIGAVGMTGFATGPHLHWEVEDAGVAVDPDALVRGPLLDKDSDFFDIDHAVAPKGGEFNSLYRSQ